MGLFDKFKKKKEEETVQKQNSKQELGDFDFEFTPDMYDFRPPEITSQQTSVQVEKQASSTPILDQLSKEVVEQEKKTFNEINNTMSYMEGAIQQLDNAPGAVRMRDVASESANGFMHDLMKREFEKNFSQYIEIKALIAGHNLGIISPEKLKTANDIIATGKNNCESFELEDILLPYLIERKGMNILTNDEEAIFNRRFLNDEDTYNRLRESFLLNCKHFNKNGTDLVRMLDNFPHTQDVFNSFLAMYGKGDSKSNNNEAIGRSR